MNDVDVLAAVLKTFSQNYSRVRIQSKSHCDKYESNTIFKSACYILTPLSGPLTKSQVERSAVGCIGPDVLLIYQNHKTIKV